MSSCNSGTTDQPPAGRVLAAHDTTHVTETPPVNDPPTLLGALRRMTERLALIPATRRPDRDAAHHLAEYCHGAIGLSEVALQQVKDTTLHRLAAGIARQMPARLRVAQRVATRLDQDSAANPAPPFDPAYGPGVRRAGQRLTATLMATIGSAGRRAHAPNLAMMEGHRDEGTGDVDADFAALALLQQQAIAQVGLAVRESGRDPQLRQLAGELLTYSRRTSTQLQAWQGRRGKPRL